MKMTIIMLFRMNLGTMLRTVTINKTTTKMTIMMITSQLPSKTNKQIGTSGAMVAASTLPST